MSPPRAPSVLGRPLDRVEGRLKVTGAARYAADHPVPGLVHAVLVTSTIAKGRIAAIDARGAEAAAGVLAVITHDNADRLPGRPRGEPGEDRALTLLQDAVVRYAGQPIAVVVAETFEQACHAAGLVRARYLGARHDVSWPPAGARGARPRHEDEPDTARGDVACALGTSEVRIERVYRTPLEAHTPMEPHATIALWEGPRKLTLYDASQGVFACRERVARLLGLRPAAVRVLSPWVGGGFGGKGPVWSHVVLAAMAARHVRRPVKLVLSREQMFGPVGWRPRTVQTVALGASRTGALAALRHDTLSETSTFDEFVELAGSPARMLYACPHVVTTHRLARLDVGTPSYMRAPGWASGTFALECAMDELAEAVGIDPLALRLRNYAERDAHVNRPWSTKALRDCYLLGAQRFGWGRRPLAAGSMRDGETLIGWGMATSVYPTHRDAASAVARVGSGGMVVVESGSQDLGTGTCTVMTQIAADALGIPPERVTFRLGDTRLPETPISGGSMTAASVGSAVLQAATALGDELICLAVADPRSPLAGLARDEVRLEGGRLIATKGTDGARPPRETLDELLARHPGRVIEARAEARPGGEAERWSAHAFGAQFVEVHVDARLRRVRVARMVGVFDVGRVLNAKTARSQLAGGMIGGIGMALTEEVLLDERLGRVVNGNLAEYHVPAQMDVPDIDVAWVGVRDERANPLGIKGIGEIGITGTAAAIANAVHHATGRRVRDLPITIDKLL